MGKQPNPDAMVRYCPECGLIGPVKPPARACCPDSFGISVRRWHAEKLERILERLRDARARGVTVALRVEDIGNGWKRQTSLTDAVEVFQQSELDAARVRGEQIAAELAKCVARGDAAGVATDGGSDADH